MGFHVSLGECKSRVMGVSTEAGFLCLLFEAQLGITSNSKVCNSVLVTRRRQMLIRLGSRLWSLFPFDDEVSKP